jgi:hypothetical protein
MKNIRKYLYCLSAASIIFAGYLSLETNSLYDSEHSRHEHDAVSVSVAIDSGADGGAAGFAILAGLSLVAASITHLVKEGEEAIKS